jgi:hypothetical protein
VDRVALFVASNRLIVKIDDRKLSLGQLFVRLSPFEYFPYQNDDIHRLIAKSCVGSVCMNSIYAAVLFGMFAVGSRAQAQNTTIIMPGGVRVPGFGGNCLCQTVTMNFQLSQPMRIRPRPRKWRQRWLRDSFPL